MMQKLDTSRHYRRILILQSRAWWPTCKDAYDRENDLVLTYDLGLQRLVSSLGGRAFYLDHLVDAQVMHRNNFYTYRFFKDWHLDENGEDIFEHRGIPFGFAFRLEIWNDLLSYVAVRANLEQLRSMRFDELFVGAESELIESVLSEMALPFSRTEKDAVADGRAYFFPIHQWMDEKVRSRKFKHRVMRWFIACQGILTSWLDAILDGGRRRTRVYFQFYHPTRKIFQALSRDRNVRLVVGHFTPRSEKSKYLTERPIPIWGSVSGYNREAAELMDSFKSRRHARLVLENGCDVSESAYATIQRRVESRIAEYLRDLDCIIDYLDRNPVHMEVMIGNLGKLDTLVDCVCKTRGVLSYLIINGLLGPEYLDESKYASVINAYSESIKSNYFRGMDNIVCLGDPRMDDYVAARPRKIDRNAPAVTIGASGFNIVDLNSYVAVEFEFLWDVLTALKNEKQRGMHARITIKVRPNGYREQYADFVQEYFPGLVDEIVDSVPMRSVLEKTDLYISIYSQTLFEASCLGIPSIYYKKDTEIKDAPFDCKSELVTAKDVAELEQAFVDFRSDGGSFDAFLRREVMEKYIGPLDGNNLKRNLDFIYQLMNQINKERK